MGWGCPHAVQKCFHVPSRSNRRMASANMSLLNSCSARCRSSASDMRRCSRASTC